MGQPACSEANDYPQLKPLMTKLFDDRNTTMTTQNRALSANAQRR
jgi:hypothetical protein